MERLHLGGPLVPLLLTQEKALVPGELDVGQRHRLALECVDVAVEGLLEPGDAVGEAGLDALRLQLSPHPGQRRLRAEADARCPGTAHRLRGGRRKRRDIPSVLRVEVSKAVEEGLALQDLSRWLFALLHPLCRGERQPSSGPAGGKARPGQPRRGLALFFFFFSPPAGGAEPEEDAHPQRDDDLAFQRSGGWKRVDDRKARLQPDAATARCQPDFHTGAEPGRPHGAGGRDGNATQAFEVPGAVIRNAEHGVRGCLPQSGGAGEGSREKRAPKPCPDSDKLITLTP